MYLVRHEDLVQTDITSNFLKKTFVFYFAIDSLGVEITDCFGIFLNIKDNDHQPYQKPLTLYLC